MTMQAVRRPAIYFRLRAWWRGLHLATQADLAVGAFALLLWWGFAIFGLELFR